MQIFTGKNALDDITSEDMLIQSSDRLGGINDIRGRFDAAKQLRQAYEDLATYTNHGRNMGGARDYKHVATIPAPLVAAALCLEPDLMIDKKKFYAWLDKHPGYQAYHRSKV
jgi:ATP adenylyltransferase/5',5'''-P-1,P-4-tetraphosphate phosphorylase II